MSRLAVIGIGASAGGLEAATQLIKAWKPEPCTAFMLVQHSDPSGGSLLAALLAPHTSLRVLEAVEGMAVVSGHLYVMPPGRYLSVEGGRLHLSTPPSRRGARMPFDVLLRSLAQHYGSRAACVVLSGTGTDGTAGLAAIKAQGGVVAVQDPKEAGYDGMPNSAIATGMADVVLPIAGIPAAIAARLNSADRNDARNPAGGQAPGATTGKAATAGRDGMADKGLPDIIALLRTQTANDLTLYKPGTLQRRISRRMALAGCRPDDMASYADRLRADTPELQALARDMLIHVTSFFRDSAVFDILSAEIIPALVASQPDGRPLRVWVAGCSTGEETYSLAMLFLEQIEAAGSRARLQVFASDVDAEAIAVARDGVYPASIEESVTPSRLARFFVREEAGWRAAPGLRAAIVFTVQDVLADPPFSRIDMVSCRNLLIYLRPEGQAQTIEAFHFALRDGGILLLGSAENPIAPEGRFETVARAERIYRRIGRRPPAAQALPADPAPHLDLARPGDERPIRAAAPSASVRPAALAELGRRLVMEAYAPASVLVDAADAVLFAIGPTDRYLRLPPGHATQDLLSMARPGLRAKLRSALQTARNTKQKVLETGWVTGSAAGQPFSLAVHPVTEGRQDLLLVCFLDAPASELRAGLALPQANTLPAHTPQAYSPQDNGRNVAELQRELDATRMELRGTVRDLELSGEEQRAINEEALSVNEEYQSTNEELVVSKEELQSLNEELTAVNSQVQETLERQRTTSDDLQNVLYSTNVATLFLDLDGRIRFFTPAIRALFAIIPGDIGRKLADFAALAPDAALAADVDAVQDRQAGQLNRVDQGYDHGQAAQQPPDREIETADGTWFRRRILPYRASGGRVEGVVITYTDVTARKAAGLALEAARTEAEAANAAKSRFLAAASHDLRQPLQTLALLQALLADAVTGEKAQSLVARQSVMLGTVTDILDTLLDINEIEAGAVQPDLCVFAIDTLLERLRAEFAYHAEAKGIRLRVVACAQNVRSDPRLLEQMVRNLLSNAIKYTSKGAILLGCRRHIGEDGSGTLSLEVIDTGIGMQNADLAAIFEEYYQVGNAARQRSDGLGLGLSVVKRLGDLLGHAIHVRSHPGSGSAFAIELPWLPGLLSKQSIPPAPAAAEPGHRLRVLVVEDDPDLAEMLGALLTSQGHDVSTVQDGPAALACLAHATPGLVARFVPDLVIADYNLPNGPNGLELSKLIRTAADRPVPVLILTGDISTTTRRAVADAGCALLNKPAGLAALREVIERLLAPPPSGTGRPVVFVVDDDDDVRSALLRVLEADGRMATGFPSAEAFLQAYRPDAGHHDDGDCLLVDAALPGISGVELLEQLRAAGHRLPVIVVTGQSDVKMAIRAMKAGAADFIEKPVSRPGLLASIVHALDSSRDAAKLVAWRDAAAAQVAGLTPRQREIMTLVLAGQPSKNIAANLGISQRTVENHRASIMHRTKAASLPALARLALAASPDAEVGPV